MTQKGANYALISCGPDDQDDKHFLAQELTLTAMEVSRTCHKNGAGSTFVHAHRRNEELYIITKGRGLFYIDGEEIPVAEGSIVRVASPGLRAISALPGDDLQYFCIQADTGSLVQATFNDGYKVAAKASWMK